MLGLKGTSRIRPCWLRKGTLSLEWPGKRVGRYDAESEVRLQRSRSLRCHRPVFGERSAGDYLPLDGLGPVVSKDSLLSANQIQGCFWGGGLGCDGSFGFERRGLGADGATDYRPT